MAYLARRGDVHAVITEDSDLLAYACPRYLCNVQSLGHWFVVRVAGAVAVLLHMPSVGDVIRLRKQACKRWWC